MHHEQNFAVQELLAAATMPYQPYGSLVPTVQQGRLSMVRRVPVGVVGAITPWNSPSVLGMRVVAPALALGNAVVLKPDPQTPVVRRRDVRRGLRGGGPARRAAPGRRRRRRRRRGDRHRPERACSSRSRARRPRAGGSARWPAACSRRSRSSSAGTTRSSCSTTPTSTPPRPAGAFASFQFQGQVCFAAGRHIVHRSVAGAYVDALTEKAKRLRLGDPYREEVSSGRSSTRSSSPAWTASSSDRSRAAPGWSRAARTRACSTGRRSSPT